MDKERFMDLLTAKYREKVAKNNWSLDAIQYGINTIREMTDNIYEVIEHPEGWQVEFLPGSNVPKCVGHLYNIHSYLGSGPVFTKMNGIIVKIESLEF